MIPSLQDPQAIQFVICPDLAKQLLKYEETLSSDDDDSDASEDDETTGRPACCIVTTDNKVRLDKLSSSTGGPAWDDLPVTLRDLIERSTRLQERVVHLDKMLYRKGEEDTAEAEAINDNPVASQLNQLHAAFGKLG